MKITKWFITILAAVLSLLVLQAIIGILFFNWSRHGVDLMFLILASLEASGFSASAVYLWRKV